MLLFFFTFFDILIMQRIFCELINLRITYCFYTLNFSIKDGEFRQYKSGRKEDELMSFVDDKKWQEVEPVSWYLSPGSYQ